jgi:hypothetical protein
MRPRPEIKLQIGSERGEFAMGPLSRHTTVRMQARIGFVARERIEQTSKITKGVFRTELLRAAVCQPTNLQN